MSSFLYNKFQGFLQIFLEIVRRQDDMHLFKF